MAVRFDLSSTNVVAYITSRKSGDEPRVIYDQLYVFLASLAEDKDGARQRLISSSPEWISGVKRAAQQALETLRKEARTLDGNEVVPIVTLREVVKPLSEVLGSYDVYVLPVGTWRDKDILDQFAHEAEGILKPGIMVLIPDLYEPLENVQVLDPSPATTEAIKSRSVWPGAIYMLRSGEAKFLPIDEARSRLEDLALLMQGHNWDQILLRKLVTAPAQRKSDQSTRLLLHMSDLHLGTDRAVDATGYVQTAIQGYLESANQVVITGDLLDQPRRRHAQQYQNFAHQLQFASGKAPIVVPGNHDQRVFGNSIFGFGRRLRQLVDLKWQEVVVDEAAQMAFFCFDSSRTGNLARGCVSTKQLLKMATEFEVSNGQGKLDTYLKVALVHHHPYPYVRAKETPVDPRTWIDGEKFIAFKESEQFLAWCASRDIGLILHGHKHIPRLIVDSVPYESSDHGRDRKLTTVGCGSTLGANGGPFSFNVIEWDPESATWNVRFMIDQGDGSGFRTAALQSSRVG